MPTPRSPIAASANDSDSAGEVCIANISPSERRKRFLVGVVQLIVGVSLLAALLYIDAPRWMRLVLFIVFWSSAVGFFQWSDKTCIGLAARDARKTGDRVEAIEDPKELAQVQKQARRVVMKSVAVGAVATVIAMLLPI
mgnify:CR=1 FL=1|jgi:thiol:disulfide interchange protein